MPAFDPLSSFSLFSFSFFFFFLFSFFFTVEIGLGTQDRDLQQSNKHCSLALSRVFFPPFCSPVEKQVPPPGGASGSFQSLWMVFHQPAGLARLGAVCREVS